MKKMKILSVVLALITVMGLAACGSDGDKTDNGTSNASSAIDTADNAAAATVDTTANTSDETTTAEETTAVAEDPDEYTVKGKNITVTVPKAETFFGFPNADFDYTVTESGGVGSFVVQITTEGMKSVHEFSVKESVGRKDETLQDLMDYRNSLQKDESTKYTACEIAGYKGIVQVTTNESLKTIKHDYYIEVPVDGTSYFIKYYVTQRFNTDTDEMHSLEETFLKNITVTKN